MASPTQITDTRRRMKKSILGKRRKNHVRNHGSTAPNLELNRPNANELKQSKKKA